MAVGHQFRLLEVIPQGTFGDEGRIDGSGSDQIR